MKNSNADSNSLQEIALPKRERPEKLNSETSDSDFENNSDSTFRVKKARKDKNPQSSNPNRYNSKDKSEDVQKKSK